MINTIASVSTHSDKNNLSRISAISFSSRKQEVIAWLIRRVSSKEIASILDISHNSVRNHINNICGKIGCSSRNEVVSYMYKTGCDVFESELFMNM